MAVDSLFSNVRALVQGGSLTNLADTKWAVTTTPTVTPGSGVLAFTPSASLTVTAAVTSADLASGTKYGSVHEFVVQLNSTWAEGDMIASGLNWSIRLGTSGVYVLRAGASLSSVNGPSSGNVAFRVVITADGQPYSTYATVKFSLWGETAPSEQFSAEFVFSPAGGAGVLLSDRNTITLGGQPNSLFSQVPNSAFSITYQQTQRGSNGIQAPHTTQISTRRFVFSESNSNTGANPVFPAHGYPSSTSFQTYVQPSGSVTITATPYNQSGVAGTPISVTTSHVGLDATSALSVAANALKNAIPGASVAINAPNWQQAPVSSSGGLTGSWFQENTNITLSLPASSTQESWQVAVSVTGTATPPTYITPVNGVWYVMSYHEIVTGTTTASGGEYGVARPTIWTLTMIDNEPAQVSLVYPAAPSNVYTVTSVTANGTLQAWLASVVTGFTVTGVSPFPNQAIFTLTSTANANQSIFIPIAYYGAPTYTGFASLVALRSTFGTRPAWSAYPQLPWPTTSIPAGGGGGGGVTLLPAEVWLALGFDNGYTNGAYLDQSRYAHSLLSSVNVSAWQGSRTGDVYAEATNTSAVLNYSANLRELDGLTGLTIEFDIYVPSASGGDYFFGPNGSVYMLAYGYGDGTADITVGGGWFNPTGAGISTNLFTANAWHHVAFVYDNGSALRSYVDGTLSQSGTAPVTVPLDYSGAVSAADTQLGILNLASRPDVPTKGALRIDNVLITKNAKYTANFTPPGPITGGVTDKTLLLLHMDEAYGTTSLDDASLYNHVVTRTTAGSGSSAGKFGGGQDLSLGLQITVTDAQSFALGPVWTIEFFVKANNSGVLAFGAQPIIIFAEPGTWSSGWTVDMGMGRPILSNNSLAVIGVAYAGIGDTNWHHVAFTCDGTGNTRMFVDGVQEDYVGGVTALNTSPSESKLHIGWDGAGDWADYTVDELRITRDCLYTAAFTPPTSPFTGPSAGGGATQENVRYYYPFLQGQEADVYIDNKGTVPATLTVLQGYVSAFGDGTYVLGNGTNQPNANYGGTDPSYAMNGACTIECWVYLEPTFNGGDLFGGQHLTFYGGGGNQITLYENNSLTENIASGLTGWHHFAAVRDGGIGSARRVYVDGVLVPTIANTSGADNWVATGPRFGVSCGLTASGADARYDDLIVTESAKYTANFTPAARGSAFIGSDLLNGVYYYFPFEQGETTLSPIVNRGSIRHTMAALDPVTQVPYVNVAAAPSGGYALQVNTNSVGYAAGGSNIAFVSIAGDFTVECWVNPISISDGGTLGVCGISSARFSADPSGTFQAHIGSEAPIVFPTAAVVGQWQHIAMSRSGSTVRVFSNGVLVGSVTHAAPVAANGGGPSIGGDGDVSGSAFRAWYDDFIVTAAGKYTANFTPPTRGNAFPLPSGGTADVSGAGYNDISDFTGTGFGNQQATPPDAYGFGNVALDDIAMTAVAYINAADITGTGPRTLANFTNTGSWVAALPTNASGSTTLGDFTAAGSGLASLPIEVTTSNTLDDFTQVSVGMFLAPAYGTGEATLEGVFATESNALINTPDTSRATITLPSMTVVGRGTYHDPDGVDVVLPTLTAVALAGGQAGVTLPALKTTASATVVQIGRVAATLPAVTAVSTGRVSGQSSVMASLPAVTTSSYWGAQVVGDFPAMSVTSLATAGAVARVTGVLPAVTGYATGFRSDTMSVAATLPMLVMTTSGRAQPVLPAITVTAAGSQVLSTTTEAYVLNMNQPLDDNPRNNFEAKIPQVTRYTNWPFTQVVRLGNDYFGVAADGLYELGGDTDNGSVIQWAVETCKTDFSDPHKKTVASAYISGTVGDQVTHTLKSGDDADKAYSYTTTKVTQQRNHRSKFGLGRRVRYYAFGLTGEGKAVIDGVEFELITTTRRI